MSQNRISKFEADGIDEEEFVERIVLIKSLLVSDLERARMEIDALNRVARGTEFESLAHDIDVNFRRYKLIEINKTISQLIK